LNAEVGKIMAHFMDSLGV